MTEAMPLLKVERLTKSFGAHRVLSDIDLTVEAGDVTCIIGPSGSGKSTLLRCLNYLEVPDSGAVFLDGEPVGVTEGGVLSQVNREVTVSALPMEIPEHLELDVTGMAIGDTLRLADLSATEGVEYLDYPEETVLATVTMPEPEEVEGEELEEGELPEGEVPEGEEAPAEGEAGEEPSGEQETAEE